MNSRFPRDDKTPLRSGYGLLLSSQENTLKRFLDIIIHIRVGKRSSLLPFQKGFVISIISLLGLYENLKGQGISYVLTSRLNQDCLENFFSRVRGLGIFYNNPTPFEVRNRVRLLLLSGNANAIPLSVNGSVSEEISGPSTSVVKPSETEDLIGFVTNELCIDIIEEVPGVRNING